MKAKLLSLAVLPALVSWGACGPGNPKPNPQPIPSTPMNTAEPAGNSGAHAAAYPKTRIVDAKDTIFDQVVADPYRWLEDAKAPEVATWMHDEDALARTALAKLPTRDALQKRLREVLYVDSMGVPEKRLNRYFFARRKGDQEKWVVYVREGKQGKERALLDPNAWAADGSSSLGVWVASRDGRFIAYTVKKNNSDESTLHVMDVTTGKPSDIDVIDGAKYAVPSWTAANQRTDVGFMYTHLPPLAAGASVAERPGTAEVRFHKLGTDPKTDALVHEKTGDAKTFISGELTRDGKYEIVSVKHGWTSNDVYFREASKPAAPWQTLVADKSALYAVSSYKGVFYIDTNDGAPRGKVVAVDPAHPEVAKWKTIVPERSDATLGNLQIVGGHLALHYMKDVVSQVEVHALSGELKYQLKLPGIGTASNLVGNGDEDEAYFSFTSFTTPTEIHETNVHKGGDTVAFKLSVPVETDGFSVEQAFASSKDGTKVPLFIVRPKNAPRDGTSPTILYGYGGFQNALTPSFMSQIFPWLERGGTYVLANLRGGSEYGEDWHRAGMRTKKQNVFDDYVAAAEYLVANKITSPGKLAARGGSNGGLLVGAALTQRPDLFRVVLCGVPLLDMVRYHMFGSGKTWVEEYGSAENEADFKAIFAYSPYHHVKSETKYPSVLMLSADSDDRVDPMHARKFAALLQARSTGGPVLLRIEKNSGHGGSDLVKASVERLADEYAFALGEMN